MVKTAQSFIYSIKIVATVFIIFLLSIRVTNAVYFASDEIVLYEDGVRILDNSIFHNQSARLPVCISGICSVGQARKLTFYNTVDSNLFNYSEWINNWYETRPHCKDYIEQKEKINELYRQFMRTEEYKELFAEMRSSNNTDKNDRLKKEIDKKAVKYIRGKGLTFYGNPDCEIDYSDYESVYLKGYIDDPRTKQLIVSFPPSDGKVTSSCPFGLCFGGRIGTPRTFKLDISRGDLEFVGNNNNILMKRGTMLVTTLLVFVGLVFVFHKILKRKKNN